MLLRKGESTTNVILFLAVLIAAIILITWYVQAIRPTRIIIATMTDDLDEIEQHLRNACSVTEYRATYLVRTPGAHLFGNATNVCLVTDVFGNCARTPCTLTPFDMNAPQVIRIEKDAGVLAVTIPGN